MRPHPDFEGRPPPKSAKLASFSLHALTPKDVEEDFRVVVESEDVLYGLFGGEWPRGLTLEQNYDDLKRHAREFDSEYAFAWIIRSADGSYLGCAYFDPTPDLPGEGKVYTWIRSRQDRLSVLSQFNSLFGDWLSRYLPDGFSLTWKSNDQPSRTGS